ncbi:MAG TPA: type II toxin-antitoxin system VapC family toxin [Acidimicrobiia bacterium]|nr:type II toxin-antitoxin system VapC family toxin [Acidimicrobiia bacterium]
MSADRVTYLDSSAIVKLVVGEPESRALRQFLRRRAPHVSSALARVEVTRAVLPLGGAAIEQARTVLGRIDLVRITDRVLRSAGELSPPEVRSLDAIHLATIGELGRQVARVVTYDDRLAAAVTAIGWSVASPA